MRPNSPAGTAPSLLRRLLGASSPLPLTTWLERHQRASLALTVWITVVVGWSAASGHSGAELLAYVVPPLLAAFVATRTRLPQFPREFGIIVGLFMGAALVAGLADGSVIAPVGFYVALAIAALYERRWDLRIGLALTFAWEALTGSVIPDGARADDLPGWGATALFAASFLIVAAVLQMPWRANRTERAGRAFEAKRLMDHLAVSEIIVELDTDGRVIEISDHGLGVLARDRHDVLGHSWVDLVVAPQQRDNARAALAMLTDPTAGPLAVAPRFVQFEHAIVNGAGERRVFRWRTTVATLDGEITGTVTAGIDITETRDAQRQLLREQRDLAHLTLLANAVARESDAREAVVEGVAELVGATVAVLAEPTPAGDALVVTRCTRPDLLGVEIPLGGEPSTSALAFTGGEPVFVGDADQSPLVSQRLRALSGGRSFLSQPIRVDERIAAVLTVAWEEQTAELGTRETNLVSLAADEAASALHRLAAMRRWEEAALTDVLTGIPNRRAFEHRFADALRRAADDQEPLSVALMDLNGFKALNDSEGHAAGDRVLKECAALWTRELRPTDTLARLGGDEFAVLLPSCGSGDVVAVAERLRAAVLHEPGCGVGIAVWNHEETAAELLHRADEALYADKAAGALDRLTSAARLAAVQATGLLEAEGADAELDELTRLVTEFLAVPASAITLVTDREQVFASSHGQLGEDPMGRSSELDSSYCKHPATTGRELVVTDSLDHALVHDNLGTTEGGVRSYAGIPLRAGGETVGVLCAFDGRPRDWSPADLDKLRQLAHRATAILRDRTESHRRKLADQSSRRP